MSMVLRLRNLALGHKTYNELSIILGNYPSKLQAAFHYTHFFLKNVVHVAKGDLSEMLCNH